MGVCVCGGGGGVSDLIKVSLVNDIQRLRCDHSLQ